MDYIKSPLNYVGGKYKLLPQILPLFPKQIETFIDLFGGGFNVGINVNANKIIYNDTSKQVVELLKYLKNNDIDVIHNAILNNISKYELSRSDINGYEHCNEKYFRLREDYNENPSPDKFYTLICCSFSNQIRFNDEGKFNMPYGKRHYNKSLQEKLKVFVMELQNKNVEFSNLNFIDFEYDIFHSGDFIYCDPPYLDSTASYNENGGWNEWHENQLLNKLDYLNEWCFPFALSNNFAYDNPLLKEWSKKYNVHYLNHNYSNCNYQKKDKDKKNLEVLITNY